MQQEVQWRIEDRGHGEDEESGVPALFWEAGDKALGSPEMRLEI